MKSNEIEQNRTKSNKIKQNRTKSNKIKQNQTKSNERNQTKEIKQTKSNEQNRTNEIERTKTHERGHVSIEVSYVRCEDVLTTCRRPVWPTARPSGGCPTPRSASPHTGPRPVLAESPCSPPSTPIGSWRPHSSSSAQSSAAACTNAGAPW